MPVTSIGVSQLKLILRSHLASEEMKIALAEQYAMDELNQADVQKLMYLCLTHDVPLFKFLKNIQVADGIRSLSINKLKILLRHGYNISAMKEFLSNYLHIQVFNSIDDEKFMLLCEIYDCEILNPLIDQQFISTIRYMDIEKLKILLRSFNVNELGELLRCRFIVRTIMGIPVEKMLLLCVEWEMPELFRDQRVVYGIDCMDIENLRLLINNFDVVEIKRLLRSRFLVSAFIGAVDDEKLSFLSEMCDRMSLECLRDKEVINAIRCIDITKLKVLVFSFELIELSKLLRHQSFVHAINSIDVEKLIIFDLNEVSKLLRDVELIGRICSVDIEKLKVLSETCCSILSDILKSQKVLDFIKTINVDTLKLIKECDIVHISECYKDDIKRNLDFAVALHKSGHINSVDYNFLSNNKEVYDVISRLFPEDFPIDQALMASEIDHRRGLILSLKDLSIIARIKKVSCMEHGNIRC